MRTRLVIKNITARLSVNARDGREILEVHLTGASEVGLQVQVVMEEIRRAGSFTWSVEEEQKYQDMDFRLEVEE